MTQPTKSVEEYNMPSIEHNGEQWIRLVDLTTLLSEREAEVRREERERIANSFDELMEQLAAIEHVRWAKWQNYLHSHITWNNELQAWILPHEWKDRWQMQINLPYSHLSEKEKESDREQVRPYLQIIKKKALSLPTNPHTP